MNKRGLTKTTVIIIVGIVIALIAMGALISNLKNFKDVLGT